MTIIVLLLIIESFNQCTGHHDDLHKKGLIYSSHEKNKPSNEANGDQYDESKISINTLTDIQT